MVSICISAFLISACARDVTAPADPGALHVLLTVTIPGHCLVGGCDPPGGGRTSLALVRALNTGTTTVSLQTCGDYVQFREEQFVEGQWQWVGPAITCPINHGPITLAPGDSLQVNWWFASGTRRMVLAGSTTDFRDSSVSTSASFVIP